jgi:transposase-like protein
MLLLALVGLRTIQMARQFEPEVILLAVGWYLRFSLFLP